MWLENEIFHADLETIINCAYIPWERLRGKTVFVTGATGLIGYNLVSALLYYSKQRHAGLRVAALVRDAEKAKEKFRSQIEDHCDIQFVEGTVEDLQEIPYAIDYVVHGASPTASAFFARFPVETATTIVEGSRSVLELARRKSVQKLVYLSSMEVYGAPRTDEPISETYPTAVDTMSVRSAYPQAKLMSENLCAGYASEYGVPAVVIRLAQTFGPGVPADDRRVFVQFARAAIVRENIVLFTTGESKRTYLYVADAVTAILTAMLNGKPGEAYNAANPQTYCSILEMAEMVARELTDNTIRVEVKLDKDSALKFPPSHRLNLQVNKLCELGWQPTMALSEMYQRMILAWE